jgi:hypothetical protein
MSTFLDLPAWEAEGYQVLGQEKAIATEQPKKQPKKSTPRRSSNN